MTNQNYDQTLGLYNQGKLHWATDSIIALLRTDTTFDAAALTVDDLDGDQRASQTITGRWFTEGLCLGLPVAFPKTSENTDYQIVVAQDIGNNDPVVLAFIDANSDSSPITVARSGTLIVRPVLPSVELPPERPPTIGVWLKLGA